MLSGDKKAGILITVAVHLTVIIFLLLTSIHAILTGHRGEMLLIDFSELAAEAKEKAVEEPQLEELSPEEAAAIQASIDRLIAERNNQHADYHNVITSRNADARNIDADQLYDDAERLAEALRNGQALTEDDPDSPALPDRGGDPKKDSQEGKGGNAAYSGASVLSWALEGRQARSLPVAAYTHDKAGTVRVIIKVNRSGHVTAASVDPAQSSPDKRMQEKALSFARQARFSSSSTAPDPQTGDIIYQFVAQ